MSGLIHISFTVRLLLIEGVEIRTRLNGITELSLSRQLGHCEASELQPNTAHPYDLLTKYCVLLYDRHRQRDLGCYAAEKYKTN